MELKGLVMPLGGRDAGPAEDAPTENAEAAVWAKAAENDRVKLAAVTAERDALRRELAAGTRERDLSLRAARECAARDELARAVRPTEVRTSAPPAPGVKLTRRERLAATA